MSTRRIPELNPEPTTGGETPTTREMWLVGRWPTHDGPWEVGGLYQRESDAVARCEDGNWFVMPLVVDERVPTASVSNPRAYYPRT